MKKKSMIVGKVDEAQKSAFQQSIEKTKWPGGESGLVRQVAEAFNTQVERGDEIAQPIQLLTVEQRRALDVLAFQQAAEKKK